MTISIHDISGGIPVAARSGNPVLSGIDLFSGIGAFPFAGDPLGIQAVFSSEIDWDCRATCLANWGHIPAGDITRIDARDIPHFDFGMGGFPCQSWSTNGRHGGFEDPRGQLIFDVIRIYEHHRPICFIKENVPNLLSHDAGESFRVIIKEFERIGYRVHWAVLNPGDYGIPVARQRLFIVGFLRDVYKEEFSFPIPTHEPSDIGDMLLTDEETSRFVIADRPDMVLLPDADNPPVELRGRQPIKVGHIRGGRHTGDTIYSPYGHAGTFVAAGGKTGLYFINGKVRKLHPRECARILGFSDSFRIMGCDSVALHQFGNSAVVPLLRLIMVEMLRPLGLGGAPKKEAA